MPKDKMEILQEVIRLNQELKKLHKQNPADPAIEPLKTEVAKKMETEEYKTALEEETRRMGEELKKLFRA